MNTASSLDAELVALRILLKRFRSMHALTQIELADILGVSQATVSRWEQGIQAPDFKMIRRLRELVAKSLPKQDQMLANMVRFAGGPRVLMNRDFIFLAVSPAFAEMVCCHREDLVGMCYKDHLSEEARQFSPKLMAAGFYSGEVSYAQVFARVPNYSAGDIAFAAIERIHPVYLSDGQIAGLIDFDLLSECRHGGLAADQHERIYYFDQTAH